MTNEDILFIRIENPEDFRKALLESLREILHGLQRFEKIKETRIKKIEEIIELNKLQKEINNLMNKLKSHFPEAKVEKKPVEASKKKVKKGKAKKEEPREMEHLESQLKDIEEKLKVLS